MSLYTHSIKYNPFDLKAFDIKSKTAIFFNVSYYLLNLNLLYH